MIRFKSLLKAGVLGAGALTAMAWSAAPAAAQQVASKQVAQAAAGGLEEIVVTARRREENVQTVPIAVTAFSESALQQQDIHNSFDMMRMVPGLVVAGGGSNNVGAYSWLRGATGVQGYFNQIPTNLNNRWMFFDLGNAQVLKGPQGTLFGLSVDAGVVLYEPKHAVDNFEGYAQATLGDYNRRTLEAVVNVPVIADKVLVRAGVQYHHQDGYIHVINRDINLNEENWYTGRLTVALKPTDKLSNETMLNYHYLHGTVGAFVETAVNPGTPAAFPVPLSFIFPTVGALVAQQNQLGLYEIAGIDLNNDRRYQRTWHVSNITSYELNDQVTLKNIFGYQQTTSFGQDHTDGLLLPIVGGPTPITTSAGGPSYVWTEEPQIQGRLFDKLTYTVGGFYQKTGDRQPRGITYSNSFGTVRGSSGEQASKTKALYAQGTYDLGDYLDGLSFTAGYRYTWDKFFVLSQGYSPLGVQVSSASQSAKFRSGSYSLQLQYQWTPQTMFYINNSKGYKTGGFNGTAIVGTLQKYGPEHLNNIEAGVKSDFDIVGDVKARANLSAYYGLYDKIQVQVTGVYPQAAGGNSLGTPFLNVGDGAIKGFEGQLTLVPVKEIEVGGNFSYNKGQYFDFIGPNTTGSALVPTAGVHYAETPKWKYNLNGTIHAPTPETIGDISFTAIYSWTGKRVNIYRPITSSFDIDPPAKQLDLSIDWRNIGGSSGLSARAYMTNVTKEQIGFGVFGVYQILGIYGFQPAVPRMWGVTLRQEF